jgi:histidinol dehydrogenase
MKTYELNKISKNELKKIFSRPSISNDDAIEIVHPIVNEIKNKGLKAALSYAGKFDGFSGKSIFVSKKEFNSAEKQLDKKVKNALITASKNIEKFHSKQFPKSYEVETTKGIKCRREFRAIENVGLYIPGGTAVLPSTMLMLSIPAKIAGCKRVVAVTPAKDLIHPAVLFAAKINNVDEVLKIGGAQAIALLAYGETEFNKVDKIFGPGNKYVTAAKTLVSIDPEGCPIDMPAGPSELLIIADENAEADFIAADILSQAEHGTDSQIILITTSVCLAQRVELEIVKQLEQLDRKIFAQGALDNSSTIIVKNIDEAIKLSNIYAPEHLILNINSAEKYINQIQNAGSVFLGKYSAESIGDYASGTNHSLPTYGYSRSISGVTVEAFMKSVSFQKVSQGGLNRIAQTVIELAETEKLDAHANAVKIRIKK